MLYLRRTGVALVLALGVALVAGCAPEATRPAPEDGGAERVVTVEAVAAAEEAAPAAGLAPAKAVDANVEADVPALPGEAATPEEAARSFYGWYIAYNDLAAGRTVRADEAYVGHPLLTEGLVARIEEAYASMQGGGYDPFLCAQDVPTAVSVGQARVYEDQAWLTVYTTFPGHTLDLTLRQADGSWRIDEITCRLPDAASRTPEQVVQAFYTWYIHYPGNVMVDKSYYGFGMYLTQELIAEIDEIIAGFEMGGYDPFLCAQDVPMAVSVGQAEIGENEATLTVYTTFPGHSLDVTLTQDGDLWRISGIGCHTPTDASERTPEQVVSHFYQWYLHYPGNPLADQAFYGFGMYLTQDLIEEIVAIVAGFEMGGYDPILLAQDLPTDITVHEAEVVGDEATVRVDTSWEGHSLTLRLVREGSLWKIAGIERAQ